MADEYFYNADGELLFVPQQGGLRLWTEFGIIDIAPGEIAVIPRGVKLRVELRDGPARGYLCENYGGAFTLPERGPIGANCMANPRDFLTPLAAYEEREAPSRMVVKWGGALWAAEIGRSPLDVVAWHGNYAPYKYDLRRYSPIGPVLFDHADPSIFTVLTSPSETPGTANVDFVLFSDRWLVAENTFRPPWYHMNVMSEFMGLVFGQYEAKPHGFVPGGCSLHNTMLPHGPDVDAFEAASNAALKPHRLEGSMAFMFETRFPQRVTAYAAQDDALQKSYGRLRARAQKPLHAEPALASPAFSVASANVTSSRRFHARQSDCAAGRRRGNWTSGPRMWMMRLHLDGAAAKGERDGRCHHHRGGDRRPHARARAACRGHPLARLRGGPGADRRWGGHQRSPARDAPSRGSRAGGRTRARRHHDERGRLFQPLRPAHLSGSFGPFRRLRSPAILHPSRRPPARSLGSIPRACRRGSPRDGPSVRRIGAIRDRRLGFL